MHSSSQFLRISCATHHAFRLTLEAKCTACFSMQHSMHDLLFASLVGFKNVKLTNIEFYRWIFSSPFDGLCFETAWSPLAFVPRRWISFGRNQFMAYWIPDTNGSSDMDICLKSTNKKSKEKSWTQLHHQNKIFQTLIKCKAKVICW